MTERETYLQLIPQLKRPDDVKLCTEAFESIKTFEDNEPEVKRIMFSTKLLLSMDGINIL